MHRRDFLKQATAGAAISLAYKPDRVLGANDRVRLGIIGAGGRGQELMKDFLRVPNIEFVAVADVYKRRHDEAARLAPGIKPMIDYRRLLDMKEVDAVIVATPFWSSHLAQVTLFDPCTCEISGVFGVSGVKVFTTFRPCLSRTVTGVAGSGRGG